jgi:hypothetical protein
MDTIGGKDMNRKTPSPALKFSLLLAAAALFVGSGPPPGSLPDYTVEIGGRFEASDPALTKAYACLDVLTEKLAHKPAVWNSLYHSIPSRHPMDDYSATFWGWDSAWAFAALMPESSDHARLLIIKTLEHQRPDGEVPTCFNHHRVSYYWNGANAYLIWILAEYIRYEGAADILKEDIGGMLIYQRAQLACDWYEKYLWDGTVGLYRNYNHAMAADSLSFDTTLDSAWDFRGGPDRKNNDFWCDFNTYYLRMHRDMAWIEKIMGNSARARARTDKADRILNIMEQRMWDPKAGLYLDLDENARRIPNKHMGCVETALILQQHIPELMEHLNDPGEVNLPWGIPSLSCDHPAFDPTDSGDHTHGAAMTHYNPRWIQFLLEAAETETDVAVFKKWMRAKKFDAMPLDGSGNWLFEDVNTLTGEDVRRPWYGININFKRTLWQGVLGIYPTFDRGLEFRPRLEALDLAWGEYRMNYRGAELEIEIRNDGSSYDVKRITVDGNPLPGTSVPDRILSGPKHKIVVITG